MRKFFAWFAARPAVAAIALIVGTGVALGAAGPANFAGVFGAWHGTPLAKMGCDNSNPQNCGLGVVPLDAMGNPVGQRKTYRYSVTGITPIAAPTNVVQVCGSATTTVEVKRIAMGGYATTGGQMLFQLVRRTTAPTLGSATLSAIAAEQQDVNDAAPTAAVSYIQTANITTAGTSGGQAGVGRAYLQVAATGPTTPVVWDFATRQDKPQILRGVADCLTVEGGGATLPSGSKFDIEIETEEDDS